MQLHKNQQGAPPSSSTHQQVTHPSTSQQLIAQLQMLHHNPQQQQFNQGSNVSFNEDRQGVKISQQPLQPAKKKQPMMSSSLYPPMEAFAPLDGSAGVSIKMTSTMGNASESCEEVSAISAFQVAQMNVIGGGGTGEDDMPHPLKKGGFQSQVKGGNGSTIIVVNNQHTQEQQLNLVPSTTKTVKKTTASQNKFDIKAIVEQAQDGAPSRKTQSHENRSHPSNNSATPMISGNSLNAHNSLNIASVIGPSQQNQQQQQRANVAGQLAAPSGSNLFASFFSQPKEHYEFLTKTLGCTPGQQQQAYIQQSILKAPSTGKQAQKKGNSLTDNVVSTAHNINNAISVIKKDSIQNLKHQQQNELFVSKLHPNSKINNKKLPGATAQSTIIYKSFQQSPAVGGAPNQQPKESLQQQQFLSHTLQTFTQNYYGAQHKKKQQTIQKKTGTQQQQLHRRDHSEIQTLKNSFAQLQPNSKGTAVQQSTQGNNSSRQMRFGQIMEELERYSISNNHQQQRASGEIDLMLSGGREAWAVESVNTTTVAQSSICESDLEYTQMGNIRASTYKRTVENQEARKRMMKYKSEERKREPSFFTKEYMDNRYVNDRVEMELKDFKAEIEKKFEGSKLCDFKYPRIIVHKPSASSTTRPNRQIKALAPNQHPHLYQNQSRGHSVEEEGYAWTSNNLNGQQRITLGGKNVIFKTTTQQSNHAKPSSSQVKNKNISILDEFPVDIIKTHDMRPQQNDFLFSTNGAKQHVGDLQSCNESMTEINNIMGGGQQLITQDSIHYYENPRDQKKGSHYNQNTQAVAKKAESQMNVLLQNFFVKQDSHTTTKPSNQHIQQQQMAPQSANMTQSTTKKSNKLVNNSQDSIMAHHFNTFDAHEQSRSKGNQTVLLQKMNENKQQQQNDPKQSKGGVSIQQQKQTPKNYSLQLNQVVKKILNDSADNNQQQTNPTNVHPNNHQLKSGVNSTSFDNHQMLYEPSFYTTESYTNKNQKKQMSNDRSQMYNSNNGGMLSAGITTQEGAEHDPMMVQTYTSVSDQKRASGGTVSTKKQLKVKRSDSNGSSGQQKNTLLNKIYRSNKAVKSPQSRQSNMNLNNQNAMNNNIIGQGARGAGDMIRIAKPSQTVNQSNINSTMSSVRQLHILQKQAPISHSRQGSSGMRQQQNQAKSTGKTQTSRLPSSTGKKGHQHNLSHVPSSSHQHPLIASNMFQTDTGASFHNYPNQNSNRGNHHTANSKDKKQGNQQIMIKNSQIKRTSGERSNRGLDNANKDTKMNQQHKLLFDSQQQQQFAILQKSFHNQAPQSSQISNQNLIPNFIVTKQPQHQQNMQTSSTGMKGSVSSSPTQKHHKKSQSLTSKNTQRSVGQSQGKLVNLGILGQISNPQTNGKGGKITYRNNYPRINTNSNGLLGGVEMNNRLISHVSTGVTSSLLMGGSNIPIQIGNCTVANTGDSTGIIKIGTAGLTKGIHYPERMQSQGNVSTGGALDQQQQIQQYQSIELQPKKTDSKIKRVVSIANQL